MAQYDLLLTQNVHATLVEYSEQFVNVAKGGLISANSAQAPTVLPVGTDTYILAANSATTTGLEWIAQAAGHTQGTDLGTTSLVFGIDTDGFDIELTAVSASKFDVNVSGGATKADIEAKDATFAKVTVVAAPVAGTDLTNKTYVDGILGANDAMTFKGTVGTGGTYTIVAFNALDAWDAGDTYKVIEAGTIRGQVCEIGDMLIATVDRASAGTDADWTVVQNNLDGAVIGPASSTNGYFAIWDGTTGQLLQDGAGAPGTMAYETAADYLTTAVAATDYVPNSLFNSQTILRAINDNTPVALTIAEQQILGRVTSGNITGLTGTQVMSILWQTAPVAFNSDGTAGQIAYDEDYMYVCTVTGSAGSGRWVRSALATNW